MLRSILKAGCVAVALLVIAGSSSQVFAQHHHGGSHHSGGSSHHHHHHGGGSYFGGFYGGYGGIGLSFGSGYGSPYGYGGGYGYSGLGYRNYYSPSYYNSGYSYPSYGYGTNVYVTPQVVTPVYRSSPSVVYRSPNVQSSGVVVQSARITTVDSGTRTNLPAVTQGARAHLNVLADAVAERTALLLNDLNAYYQNSPQFAEVYRDMELLAASAKQIPSLAADSQSLLAAIHDLNSLFNALNPAIESWQPSGGGSAASHLSSVKSALHLLSIDAGYDPSHPVTRPVQRPASTPAPTTTAKEPTPADAVPAP